MDASTLSQLPPNVLAAFLRDPRLAVAADMQKQGSSTEPVKHPLQGVARMVQGALGGYTQSLAANEYAARGQKSANAMANYLRSMGGPYAGFADQIKDNPDLAGMAPDFIQSGMKSAADLENAKNLKSFEYANDPGQIFNKAMADYLRGGSPQAAPPMPSGQQGSMGLPPLPSNAPAATAPGQGGSNSVPVSNPNDPRGMRNNNPGNLRSSGDNWQGMTGQDSGGYLQFSSPEAGLRAMAINLKNQNALHGLNTIEGIITKYAPASENNTAAYIQNISQKLGVQPNQPLNLNDPKVLQALQTAMIGHENGQQPYSPEMIQAGVSQAVGGQNLPPQAQQPPAAPPQRQASFMPPTGVPATPVGYQVHPGMPMPQDAQPQYLPPTGPSPAAQGNAPTISQILQPQGGQQPTVGQVTGQQPQQINPMGLAVAKKFGLPDGMMITPGGGVAPIPGMINDTTPQGAYAKQAIGETAKTIGEMQQVAAKAAQSSANVDVLRSIDPSTGAFAPVKAQVDAMMEGVGLSEGKNAQDYQQAIGLLRGAQLGMFKGEGAVSNFERQIAGEINAQLTDVKQAWNFNLDRMQNAYARQGLEAQIANQIAQSDPQNALAKTQEIMGKIPVLAAKQGQTPMFMTEFMRIAKAQNPQVSQPELLDMWVNYATQQNQSEAQRRYGTAPAQ